MRVWQYTGLDIEEVGGVEKHVSEISANLRELGHPTHIGTEIPGSWLADSEKQMVLHTQGDLWVTPGLLSLVRKARHLRWIHVCHGTSVGRVIACREFTSLSGFKGSLRDFLPTQFAHAAVAVGAHALTEARRYFRMRIPATVIPNGVRKEDFSPLQSIESKPRLAFVGRATDRVKNIPALLEACAKVQARHSELEVWAAPGIDTSHAFVKDQGPLNGANLGAMLAKCRALALCSFYEGDPIVLREAQALGLPVLVSDLPQIRANLENYPNVVWVNPRDATSLEKGVEQVLFSTPRPSPTPRLRTWSQAAKEFETFYEEVFKNVAR
jgi:glycosyltransferase involved in cell wall biosynthesis